VTAVTVSADSDEHGDRCEHDGHGEHGDFDHSEHDCRDLR